MRPPAAQCAEIRDLRGGGGGRERGGRPSYPPRHAEKTKAPAGGTSRLRVRRFGRRPPSDHAARDGRAEPASRSEVPPEGPPWDWRATRAALVAGCRGLPCLMAARTPLGWPPREAAASSLSSAPERPRRGGRRRLQPRSLLAGRPGMHHRHPDVQTGGRMARLCERSGCVRRASYAAVGGRPLPTEPRTPRASSGARSNEVETRGNGRLGLPRGAPRSR